MRLLSSFVFLICYCLVQPGIILSGSRGCQPAPSPALFTDAPPELTGPSHFLDRLAAEPGGWTGLKRPTQNEPWRSRPPAPKPVAPPNLPRAARIPSPMGVLLVAWEAHRALFGPFKRAAPAGEVNAPPRQTGLAEATADLLTEGAGGLTSHQLATEVEKLGGRISSS